MIIDPKLQADLRAKFNPDGSDLRNAQLRMLDLLKFLDKICRDNNLEYWLDSGTLIGASRHGGFIPWDDDVDVCMMKKDADRLKEIMEDKIWDNHVILQNHDTDTNYFHPSWMTLRDTKSEYIIDQYYQNIIKYKGFQVDIFIIEENIPEQLLKFSRNLYNILVTAPLMGRHHLSFLRKMVPFNYNFLTKCIHPLFNRLKKRTDTISSGFGAGFLKIQNKNVVFPLNTIQFEGYKFLCPHDYNAYLRKLYGNWEILPALDKIHTHEVKFKFLED